MGKHSERGIQLHTTEPVAKVAKNMLIDDCNIVCSTVGCKNQKLQRQFRLINSKGTRHFDYNHLFLGAKLAVEQWDESWPYRSNGSVLCPSFLVFCFIIGTCL